MARMSATEASRNFSAVLNRVSAGERIEITRSGSPVAVIEPPAVRLVSSAHLRELLATAPRPDEAFADDVRALRSTIGPPREPWPS
ncbi:MAG: type II toxin-antitoxin system Phd/YefM family antitoxin [Thermoanaerobaculia bacterium]